MEALKTISPIFFGKTRSFWFGILPLLLTLFDSAYADLVAGGTGGPLVDLIVSWTGHSATEVQGLLLKLAPVWALIFAQQRGTFSGATPRPYTINPANEKLVSEIIENGLDAFNAGRRVGEAVLKNSVKK